MRKKVIKLLQKIINKLNAKELKIESEIVKKLTDEKKEYHANFLDAMGKGLFDTTPIFKCKGVDYYLFRGLDENEKLKLVNGRFSLANQISYQHSQSGMTLDRLTALINLAEKQAAQAHNDLFDEDITKSSDGLSKIKAMLLGIKAEANYGNDLLMQLEIISLLIVSPFEDPYNYDYNENLAKINDWASDYDKLSPLFFSIPIHDLIGLPSPLQINTLLASNREVMESIETQMMGLTLAMNVQNKEPDGLQDTKARLLHYQNFVALTQLALRS